MTGTGFPGPAALGRGVVVAPGAPVPSQFATAPRVIVDGDALADPGAVLTPLHDCWSARRPVVVELGVDQNELKAPQTDLRPLWRLPRRFEFARERLHFLVWANTWDLRSGEPVWWWARKAERLGATVGGPADVLLPDGSPAWCDGGPRGPVPGLDPTGPGLVSSVAIDAGRLDPDHQPVTAPVAVTDLAADQRAAVLHGSGPARIIAPAGSGKTRVLTARYRHLITERGWSPDAVTAVAYNVKAAAEMRARTADVPGAQGGLRTLHSLGFAILRATSPGLRVLDEREVRGRIERLAPVRPRAGTDVLAPYLEALGETRARLADPAAVEEDRDDVPDFARVFERYRDGLAGAGEVDFDEQIYGAVETLLRDPGIRQRVQPTTRHLLVDEFQDLTPAQLLMIRLLAAPAYDVFGVGDDDQTIYGYAGADPSFLIDYADWFPGAHHHALTRNYRCPQPVVTAATTLLGYNHTRVDKQIEAARTDPAPDALTVRRVPGSEAAPAAVDHIRELLDGGAEPAQVAVLARVNATLLGPQILLPAAGIPATAPLGPDLVNRTGVRTALAYLRLAAALADGTGLDRRDLTETVVRPARRINQVARELLGRRRGWSIDALEAAGASLGEREEDRWSGYLADLLALGRAAADGATTEGLLVQVRDRIGLGSALDSLDRGRSEVDRSAHGDDLASLIQVAPLHDDPRTFGTWLTDALRRPGDEGGVTVSTVHRVKGMEWPHVVVVGADAGLMPHRLAGNREEERRIFHVAMTRTSQSVLVLADRSDPSQFLAELTGAAPRTPAELATRAPDRGVTPILKSGAQAEPAVVEALKAWRLGRAREQGVPAYVVLHDRNLEAIAARMPATLDELAYCPGIGPVKLERYGDEILEVLEASGNGA